jgi:hypothetical protein
MIGFVFYDLDKSQIKDLLANGIMPIDNFTSYSNAAYKAHLWTQHFIPWRKDEKKARQVIKKSWSQNEKTYFKKIRESLNTNHD